MISEVDCTVINVHEQRVLELEKLIVDIRNDLKMRAEFEAALDGDNVDEDGTIVVNISSGLWETMREVEASYKERVEETKK